MKHYLLFSLCLAFSLGASAQSMSSFDKFRKEQQSGFNKFRREAQADYDAFRRQANEAYAALMKDAWKNFKMEEPVEPVKQKDIEPVVYQPIQEDKKQEDKKQEDKKVEDKKIEDKKQEVKVPVVISVNPTVVVIPAPQPQPEPIAPVVVKEDQPHKTTSISFYGTLVSIGFPKNDNFRLTGLSEQNLSNAWKQLSDSKYDITVNNILDKRSSMHLCDWAYVSLTQQICEKQYGKSNEAVFMTVYLLTQSGYRVRMGYSNVNSRLYALLASQYGITSMGYYTIDGVKYYPLQADGVKDMHICKAGYEKERSLSLQITTEQGFDMEATKMRSLTGKKGVSASVNVNKNMLDFYESYPRGYFNNDPTTCWVAYANTPMEKCVREKLYPQLQEAIKGLNEREAVEKLLNWVQTAFTYEYDDKVWGHDRPFFASETLYYPYCDCEDRSILFSRIVRDLLHLDVVLLYYPGHLATAVAFTSKQNGDYLTYKSRPYIVCDPTYIGAGVGLTMPGMNNQTATIVALN